MTWLYVGGSVLGVVSLGSAEEIDPDQVQIEPKHIGFSIISGLVYTYTVP